RVDAACLLGEAPQVGVLVREPVSFLFVVGWAGTDQDRQPSPDRLTVQMTTIVYPAHRRVADPLNDDSHESWIVRPLGSAWRRCRTGRLQPHRWDQHTKAGFEQVENCLFVRLVAWGVLGLKAERSSDLQARPDQAAAGSPSMDRNVTPGNDG